MMAVCPYADTNICVFHKMCNAKCEMPKKAICFKKESRDVEGLFFLWTCCPYFYND